MEVSANWYKLGIPIQVKNWVLAIDLLDNSLLWKVLIEETRPLNHAGGQYTILMDESGGNPRVVFGKWSAGVMAIGAME